MEAGEALATFAELSIGGPILGILVGMITLWILKRIHFDSTSDITITLVACYGIFILAEGLMPFQVSGILAVVSLGLMLSSSGRAVVADHHHVHQFWEIIEYFGASRIHLTCRPTHPKHAWRVSVGLCTTAAVCRTVWHRAALTYLAMPHG